MDFVLLYAVLSVIGGMMSTMAQEEMSIDGTGANKVNNQEQHDDPHGSSQKRRIFGNVLFSGFKLGKKSPEDSSVEVYQDSDIKPEDKKWKFGSVLGHGFKSGKRVHGADISRREFVPYKREEYDSVDRDIEEVDLDGPVDDKRWAGDVFGGGLSYNNRRIKRDLKDKGSFHYFGPDTFIGRQYHGDSESMYGDEPMYADEQEKSYYGHDDYRFDMFSPDEYDEAKNEEFDSENVDFEPDIQRAKKYIESSPGYRFNFGKRQDEPMEYDNPRESYFDADDDEDRFGFDKRRIGFVLGRGFAFGKRSRFDAQRKRPFGHILGHGLSSGKRTYEDSFDRRGSRDRKGPYQIPEFDDDMEMNKRYGWVLGRGFMMGKRGSKRFGWILGRGLKFGKRGHEEGLQNSEPEPGYYFVDENGHIEELDRSSINSKRFGHVLGSGFTLGKKSSPNHLRFNSEFMPEKRGWGFMLGRGFRLGKR